METVFSDNSEIKSAYKKLGVRVMPLSSMEGYSFRNDLRRLGFQQQFSSILPSFDFIERCLEYIEFLEFDLKIPVQVMVDCVPVNTLVSRQAHPRPECDRFLNWVMTDSVEPNTRMGRVHSRRYSTMRKKLKLSNDTIKTSKGEWRISWGSVLYSASYLDCLLFDAGMALHKKGFKAPHKKSLLCDVLRIRLVHKMLVEVFRYKYGADLPTGWRELKFGLENDSHRCEDQRIGFRAEISVNDRKSADESIVSKSWRLDSKKMEPFNTRIWVPTYRAFLSKHLYDVGDGY